MAIRMVMMDDKQKVWCYTEQYGLNALDSYETLINLADAIGRANRCKVFIYSHEDSEIRRICSYVNSLNLERIYMKNKLGGGIENVHPKPGQYRLIAFNHSFYSLTMKRERTDQYTPATIEVRHSRNLINRRIERMLEDFGYVYDYENEHKNLEAYYKILIRFIGMMEEQHGAMSGSSERLTIGSYCLKSYKNFMSMFWSMYFPNLGYINIDGHYDSENAEEYTRKAYWGGIVLSKKGYYKNGCLIDATSMYPSQMHSSSGNYYPYGEPHFWRGNRIPEEALQKKRLYIVRIKGTYQLKEGCVPFITSQRVNVPEMWNDGGFVNDTRNWYHYDTWKERWTIEDIPMNEMIIMKMEQTVELTFTSIDFEMFNKYYDARYEILDGCWFDARVGMFDEYVEYWFKKKEDARDQNDFTTLEISKLMLNNLGGQFGTKSIGRGFDLYEKGYKLSHDTEINIDRLVYVPVAAFMTSYARKELLRVANANYKHIVGGDTDSLNLNCSADQVVGIKKGRELGTWKVEHEWDECVVLKNKTYGMRTKSGRYIFKASGMQDRCQANLVEALSGVKTNMRQTEEEAEWCKTTKIKLKDLLDNEITIPGYYKQKEDGGFELSTYLLSD